MKKLMAIMVLVASVCHADGAAREAIFKKQNATLVTPTSKIHKCTEKTGKITFSNEGCGNREKWEEVKVKPNVIDGQALRGYRYYAPAAVEYRAAPAQEPYRDPIACENAKRMFNFIVGYRYQRPGEYQARANDVFNTCGYWP